MLNMVDSKLMTIREVAEYLGVSLMTLRRWDKSGKLPAIRKPGGHRYYERGQVEAFNEDLFSLARVWVSSEVPPDISSKYYCQTQDSFRARHEKMALFMKGRTSVDILSLVTAIAGEIGNNSFDHNLGNWPDVLGIFFGYDLNRRVVILADRGVGIRETLSRVRADLKDDLGALNVAMTERISGRSPEQRGNGLKFVTKVANENPIGITLQSGVAVATIKKEKRAQLKIGLADRNIRGVLAKIEY